MTANDAKEVLELSSPSNHRSRSLSPSDPAPKRFSLADLERFFSNFLQKDYIPHNELDTSMIDILGPLVASSKPSSTIPSITTSFQLQETYGTCDSLATNEDHRSPSCILLKDPGCFLSLITSDLDLMWHCGVYMPLYLFLEDTELEVFEKADNGNDDWDMEIVNYDSPEVPVKPLHVLNVSKIGRDEHHLTHKEWSDAYRRFISYLNRQRDSSISKRWEEHYRFCLSKLDANHIWPAILSFDIQERFLWISQGHNLDEKTCEERWKVCNDMYMLEQLELCKHRYQEIDSITARHKSLGDHLGLPRSRRDGHAIEKRYRPYPTASSSKSRDRAPYYSSQGIFCLLCGFRGHHALYCFHSTGVATIPRFAKWDRIQALLTKDDEKICVQWNLKGRCGGGVHTGIHICSLCGSPSHHATSKSSLQAFCLDLTALILALSIATALRTSFSQNFSLLIPTELSLYPNTHLVASVVHLIARHHCICT